MKAPYSPIQPGGWQPDRNGTIKKDEDLDHDPTKAPIFHAKVSLQRNLKVTPNSKDYNIYDKLPIFNQEVLYPEYAPNMQLYKKEAALLANYMREHYQIDYSYAKNGLLEIPLEERWLKGEEYAFLLRHYKTYS